MRTLAEVLRHVGDGRCDLCWRPIATDEDWAATSSGQRDDLCWESPLCAWSNLVDPDQLRAHVVVAWLREAASDEGVVETVAYAVLASDGSTDLGAFCEQVAR